jgi:hypothetical protein
MYASSCWFKLDIIARDDEGGAHQVAPTELALLASPSARPFLAGGDHFRRTYDTAALRRHVGDLGRLACVTERGRASSIAITLVERSGSDDSLRTTHETVACPR